MERLKGQIAWISGGASGMGEAIAELFAQEGAMVAVADIQAELGRNVVDRIEQNGGKAVFYECDVSQEEQIRKSIDSTVERYGGLQIVVNCAGIIHDKKLHECSEEDWNRLMDVNVKSIFFSIKHSIAHFRKNDRSYMANIGSIGSFIGQDHTPIYITSKHAVLGLSRSIALDYAVDGLRCNCVCPGITDTPMLRDYVDTTPDPEAYLAERLQRVPIGISIMPIDIAKTTLYLCCEDSSGVTGTSLVIDGGYLTPAEWEAGTTKFMEKS